MMTTADVSVIIVNRNGGRYLPECLAALDAQELPPGEVLIIDNASTDDSLDVIAAFRAQRATPPHAAPKLRVLQNTDNIGFGCANNQGIRATSGDHVLLLNADVVLAPHFLSHLVAVMRRHAAAGLAVGKLLNYADRRRIDSAGLVIRKNRRAYDRGQGDIDTGQYDDEREVFGASGAACLCRRAMLEDIRYADEYFDALFFAYKGDVDLSWRARLCGWTCRYTPDAVGWHHRTWGVGKRRDIPRRVRRHSLKNRYLMLLKNECPQTLLPGLFHILGFELLSLLFILFREPYLFAAFYDVARLLPATLKKRRHIQRMAARRQQCARLRPWFL